MLGDGTKAVWEVAELARKAGMNYGMYVATHPPIPAPGREDRHKDMCKCKKCGKWFAPTGNRRIFCSDECYIRDNYKYKHAKRKERKPETKSCPICGTSFVTLRGSTHIYCSSRCVKRAYVLREREKRESNA